MLKKNRSAPNSGIIPVLYYPEVRKTVDWLTKALPLIERLRIDDSRSQLVHENGAIITATPGAHPEAAASTLQSPGAHSIMLRVTNIDKLFERAKEAGATVLSEPGDEVYGERQCSFVDPWGRPWTLSETIFNSDPADWGGDLLVEDR
jgi:PhnB protein